MTNTPTSGNDWWESFFDDHYADLQLERPADLVERTTTYFFNQMGLQPGDTVFDQCCGVGTWSLALGRKGIRTIGVDLQERYIQRARQTARVEGLPCDYHAGDAFTFTPSLPCAGAYNWFTSFGYTADDERNQQMFHRAFEALRPGGRFLLETINLASVFRDFQDCVLQRYHTPEGEIVLLRETRIDWNQGLFAQQWTYLAPTGERIVRQGATRMYLPHSLAELLRGCGFADIEFHGSVAGEPLTRASPRCIVLATRPR
jgi:2-polyprenyl-3-methyl-5-hydroxy-6-metoxy-1,4-benzoquinol methylase